MLWPCDINSRNHQARPLPLTSINTLVLLRSLRSRLLNPVSGLPSQTRGLSLSFPSLYHQHASLTSLYWARRRLFDSPCRSNSGYQVERFLSSLLVHEILPYALPKVYARESKLGRPRRRVQSSALRDPEVLQQDYDHYLDHDHDHDFGSEHYCHHGVLDDNHNSNVYKHRLVSFRLTNISPRYAQPQPSATSTAVPWAVGVFFKSNQTQLGYLSGSPPYYNVQGVTWNTALKVDANSLPHDNPLSNIAAVVSSICTAV